MPPDVVPPPLPGLSLTVPFFVRRIWTSFRPRPGAPERVPFAPAMLSQDPSISWIGHSTFLVGMDGSKFLTDPMFSERASPFSFLGPRRMVPPGISLPALPSIDFVLLSHDHYDHADRSSVRHLARAGAKFIVPRGMAEWVRGLGGNATELDWWQEVGINGLRVTCVPARHFSGRSLRDRNRRLWCGWVVSGPTRRFYYAGDTAYPSHFREIGQRLGRIDLAAVPIGAYLPLEMMHPVHTTPEEAVELAAEVGAGRVLAMHFGTFDLSDEPVDEPPRRFRAAAERRGWGPDRAWVLKIGETRIW